MIAIWVAYLLAAGAASGIFIAAGWRSRQAKILAAAKRPQGLPPDPLWGDADVDVDPSEGHADIAGAIRLALKRLAPVLAKQSIRTEVAAPAGLIGRMGSTVLTDLLEELLTAAIEGAPASRLLLTAATHDDRICLGITDDVPGADQAVRAGNLRGLMQRVALRGGALEVDVRPSEGTTMILCLAAAGNEGQV